MFKAILYLAANVLCLLALNNLLDNFSVDEWTTALVFTIILTLLNWTVIPIIKFFAFPITFLTLGLFNLVINLVAVWFVVNYTEGIELTGEFADQAISLIIISLVLSVASHVAKKLAEDKNDD